MPTIVGNGVTGAWNHQHHPPDSHNVINWRVLNVGDMDPTLHDQMTGTTRA